MYTNIDACFKPVNLIISTALEHFVKPKTKDVCRLIKIKKKKRINDACLCVLGLGAGYVHSDKFQQKPFTGDYSQWKYLTTFE